MSTHSFHSGSLTHDLQALKEKLRIPELWQRLGLPGSPRASGSCRSPFRKDSSPSFSIYADGRQWKDFGTGEGGDAIDFIARACALDPKEATRRFLAMAGVEVPSLPSSSPVSLRPHLGYYPSSSELVLPCLHPGSVAELEAVARSRGLHPAAISLARSLGLLAFGEVCGHASWVLMDASRRVAEARRMDRLPYPAMGDLGERKAHTLRGSCKSWPVGAAVLKQLPHFRAIMLVEGGPDLLAALHFCLEREVHDVLPVAMLGRSTGGKMHPEALALLKGRPVRVYPHNDADGGGLKAANIWANQLFEHGCEAAFFSFKGMRQTNGKPVSDLNDAVHAKPARTPRLRDLFP